MDNRLSGLRSPRQHRLATSCSAASTIRLARETASVPGRTFSALHTALAMDSVMGIINHLEKMSGESWSVSVSSDLFARRLV